MSSESSDIEQGAPAIEVPRTADDRQSVLADRRSGWEFLVFAGVLSEGLRALELRWREHQLRIPAGPYHRVSEDEVATYLSEAFGRLGWILRPLNPLFEGYEDAFGKPGEPGDAALIEHFGGWIVMIYERLLDWASTVRSADVPDGFDKAFDLSARAADMPIMQIRDFVDNTVAQTEQLATQLALTETEHEPIRLDFTLNLAADEELMQAAIDELKAALGQSE